jgi:hypothetical protein
MDFFLILLISITLSITIGYFGVAFEHGAKKLKGNHSKD